MKSKSRQKLSSTEHQDPMSAMYQLVLQHEKDGVMQSEVWKKLNLTSRDGSRIALRLEKRRLIMREKALIGGRWTYRLRLALKPVVLTSIEQMPCLTCQYETQCRPGDMVSPTTCPPELEGRGIGDWVLREFYQEKQER